MRTSAPESTTASSRRLFLVLGAVALVIAGVVSYYASSHPDGLEYVAESTGFGDTAEDHAAADGPLADYAVKGVDDARLSGGLAGVIGVLVTLAVAGGLAYALRRRHAAAADGAAADVDDAPAAADRD
ncbi:PDGLE domain-containing protein [Nocardioides jishulii]|uniref:PDGLE domain-containing protein n=1 Tax=Nocardioides jishulii TaxID=2575440 RepID=UPI001484DEB7|nr:PDGLE domain-containing protein [Nocardioides jishulii]